MMSASATNSNLSAEAESFVPGALAPAQDGAGAGDPGGGGASSGGDAGLPRFVTSCYPFVQETENSAAAAVGIQHQGYAEKF